MSKKIAVIGGDMRQIFMAQCMDGEGYDVTLYGFDRTHLWRGANYAKSIEDAVADAKVVVLGLPASIDKATVNTPCWNGRLYIEDILQKMEPESVLAGGMISEELEIKCRARNLIPADYFKREDLTILNGIPTAEGAVGIALEELPYTLHDCNCLVAGFGRVGEILTHLLQGMGAKVTCTARKHEDLAWIKAYGYQARQTKDLKNIIHEYTAIFNTIPSKIFTREVLRNVRNDAVVIDLASKPGGVDFEAAKDLGIKVIWALSLPGKVAPATAGRIIKDTIVNMINEM